MLVRLLRGTEWQEFSSYLSPSFFDVVHPLVTVKVLKRMATDFVTGRKFADMARQLQTSFDAADFPVKLEIGTLDVPKRDSGFGNLLLQLYFRQIFDFPFSILDYRRSRFEKSGNDEALVWRPKPLFIEWDTEFIGEIRRLYRGFYEEHPGEFDKALVALGLDTAKDELLQHFGPRQEQVHFNLAQFRATFHQIFVGAKRGKRRLPADFLPFGAGLACLYEHLEQLGGVFDVRAAYFAAIRGRGAIPTG